MPEIEKVEQEARAGSRRRSNYWDSRAFELKEEEKAGRKTRLSWQKRTTPRRGSGGASETPHGRSSKLSVYLIAAAARAGGMIVIPRCLSRCASDTEHPNHFAEDPAARQ